MDAGKLRSKIQIQRADLARGLSGGMKKGAWTDVASAPIAAAVENKGGTKRATTTHGGEVPVATVLFTIRYRAGLDESMRVLFGGKAHKIQHIQNVDERSRWLVLSCESGVAP